MPTYGYSCNDCGHQVDIFQKITDQAVTLCPKCAGHHLQRGPGGGAGLAFKGTGFYITDYCKTPAPAEQPAASAPCCPCGKSKTSC